jgi:hypothetical protein
MLVTDADDLSVRHVAHNIAAVIPKVDLAHE